MTLRSLKYPLELDGNGSLATVERADVISQQIISAIETNPGERIMLPLYGMRDRILSSFQPAVVVSDIENQLQRWVPSAKNVKVLFEKDARRFEEGKLDIRIEFQFEDRDVVLNAELSDDA
jgi:phage baseplate assembly protein W